MDPPRERGPPTTEELLRALETDFKEHTQVGMDVRKDVYAKFGAVSHHMEVVEAKFDGQLDVLRRHLQKAEAQLSMDGC